MARGETGTNDDLDRRWREAVEKVLKGAAFEQKLVGRTSDGIRVEPLYPKSAHAPVAGRGAARWTIMQRVDHPDIEAANAQALADLENGASGLSVVLAGSPTARGYGAVIADIADLDALLAGVHVDLIPLRFETAPFDGRRIADLVRDLPSRRGLPADALTLDLGLDPLGDMARAGGAPLALDDLIGRAAGIARGLHEDGFGGRFLRADGRAVHEAGGSEAQELAFVLAALVAYLRALDVAGFALDEARRRLSATLVVDADEFLSVAKLRALRLLWARIEEESGLEPRPLSIHAETGWRALTQRDPWVNLLRGTIGAFAAAVGGADSIAVLPFTAAIGLADGFARRLARNTQLVLAEEANLWRVADPAAGAGGFEALTDELCAAAWAQFQAIERAGGLGAALAAGLIQTAVAGIHAERMKAVGRRRQPITGTSEFPDIHELPVAVLEAVHPPQPVPLPKVVVFDALRPHRLAEPFEALRDRSDAYLALHGTRPRVFLANLGSIAAFTPRATFAKSFFEAGGIEAVTNDGFPSMEALVRAFRSSGASLACIASSDEVYAMPEPETGETMATLAAAMLRGAGAAGLFLAGRAGEAEAALREAGIGDFIFVGCDVLAVLDRALRVAERDAEETA